MIKVAAARVRKSKSTKDISALLDEAHSLGHWGATGMYKYLQLYHATEVFEISNLLQQCKSYCNKCETCQNVINGRIGYAPRKDPEMCLPGEHIHADLLQLWKTKLGYKYVLVMIDKFSGFVWLAPLVSKNAKKIAEEVLKVVTTFGFPHTIKTDNGKEIVNKLMERVCELGFIVHNKIIPYNHHANSLVERMNATVCKVAQKLVKSAETAGGDDWDKLLPFVTYAINTRVHSTMSATPFSLMFGRAPIFANPMSNFSDDLIWPDEWNIILLC
jgi:cleavage and polyadenylation specificity factor subunit 1